MLILAFLCSGLLCVALSMLCGRNRFGCFRAKDFGLSLLLFAAVVLFECCVYSNPGITINFGRFKCAAFTATALWVSLCVVGIRLRNRIKFRAFKILLILFIAGGIEVFICNMAAFATHNYRAVDLTKYITADTALSKEDGLYQITQENLTIIMSGMEFPIYNLQLSDLNANVEGESYNEQNTAISIAVYVQDSAHQVLTKLSQTAWYVSNLSVASQTTSVWLSGDVDTIKLEISSVNGAVDYSVSGITANVRRDFQFSWLRFGGMVLIGLLFLAFRPSSVLWEKRYLECRGFRPVTLLFCMGLILLSLTLPMLNPKCYGFATSTWNSDKWDEEKWITLYSIGSATCEYSELAESILQGSSYLLIDVSDALLETDNPYDVAYLKEAGIQYEWDHAYYEGHYYVYFGIVPCLLMQLPLQFLTEWTYFPTWLNVMEMGVLFSVALIFLVRQLLIRWFPKASVAAFYLICGAFAFGTQFLNLLYRPLIYETAILSGSTMLLLGLGQWLVAANLPAEKHKRVMLHMGLGSLFVALVAGCRPQMILFAFVCIPIFWNRYITDRRVCSKDGILEAICFALPVAMVAAGLMFYNFVRFGSVVDFGANYNQTTNDMNQRGFNPWRIGPAIFSYFFQLPSISTVFPFVKTVSAATSLIGTHISEKMQGGVIACAPVTWFLASLPVQWRAMKRKSKELCGIVCICLGAAVVLAVLDGQMAGILTRYEMDFSPMLIFATAICILVLEERLCLEGTSLEVAVRLFFRWSLLLAVFACVLFRFFVLFVPVEANYMSNNPALYAMVMRLIQFWI